MQPIVRMRLRRKVICAVQVYDDFTGKLLTGSRVQVRRADGGTDLPICKDDGFFVFLQTETPLTRLRVQSAEYQPLECMVDTTVLNPLEPVLELRLLPSRQYPLPPDTTCICGKAAPNCPVQLIGQFPDDGFQLMADIESPQEIALFHRSGSLAGKRLALTDKSGKLLTCFTIAQAVQPDEGRYRLAQPLQQTYRRQEVRVASVLQTQTDADGNFFLPIAGIPVEKAWHGILRTAHTEQAIALVGGQTVSVEMECM